MLKNILPATVFVLMLITGTETVSQVVFGVDVSDPSNTAGYIYNNSNDAAGSDLYLKTDPGIFDRVILLKNTGFTFTIFNPSANRLVQVSDSLRKAFGYENETMDSIPPWIDDDDYAEITRYVQDGKASILRFWYREKFNVKFEYSGESLKVLLAYN